MEKHPFPGYTPYPREVCLWWPQGHPKGLVVLSHGMAEHVFRYDQLAGVLSANGYLVVGANHLGHGPEAPKLGWIAAEKGWDRLIEDLKTVLDWAGSLYPDVPKVLLGHSMGSFLAREFIIRYPESLDALVLSGTGWHTRALCLAGLLPAKIISALGGAEKPSPLLHRLAFSANNKPFHLHGGTGFEWLSRDKAEVQKYAQDPYCGFVFTAAGFRDLFGGLLALSETNRLKDLPESLPVFLISGRSDPVAGTDGSGVQSIATQYRSAGLRNVKVQLYQDARHELFFETNQEQVTDDLLAWLGQTIHI